MYYLKPLTEPTEEQNKAYEKLKISTQLLKSGILLFKKEFSKDLLSSEELVIEKTRGFLSSLIETSMATATVFFLPRRGPTFGAMLFSGEKAGQIVIKKTKNKNFYANLGFFENRIFKIFLLTFGFCF